MHEIERNELIDSVAAASGDCIVAVRVDGRVLWASPATEAVLGWSPLDLVGTDVSALGPGGVAAAHAMHLMALGDDEHVAPYADTVTRRDGSSFEAVLTPVRLGPAGGELVGLTVMVRDVAAERQAQRELELALELSRATFEQTCTPQSLLDLQGRFLSVNPAWCELFGQTEEALVGREIFSAVHPMDLANVAEQLAPLRRGDVDSASYEAVFRDGAGRSLNLMLDATLLRRSDGTPHAVAAFAKDLTEVKESQRRLAAQEQMYRALGRRSWDTAIVTDEDLDVVYVAPSVAQMLGYRPEEIFTVDAWTLIHPDDVTKVQDVLDRVTSQPQRTERLVARVQHKLGRWRWLEVSMTNCMADPDIGGLVLNLRDITEQVEAQQALRLSEARYRAIVETAQEGIVATSPEGVTLFANDKMAEILGLGLDDVYRLDTRKVLQPGRDVPATQPRTAHDVGPARYETTYAHPDGGERVLSVSSSRLNAEGPETGGLLCMVSDVTEARRAESKLRQQALHDPLTGLPNRYLLLDRLQMAAARHDRSEDPHTAVLFLDLDGFKSVNDNWGHQAGDELLVQVAARLTAAVRTADTVGRLGGDEFAVICEGATEDAAMLVATRIHDTLREPVALAQGPLRVTASIGVALSPPIDVPDLLRPADVAMYEAKELGGGRTAVFREQG